MIALFLSLVALGELAAGSPPGRRRDTEEELLARMERERDPVKKAHFGVRLGNVKLLQAIDAYDAGDHERCLELLDAYSEHVRNAWAGLRAASRKLKGYREMDLALRDQARLIEDLRRRVASEDREAVGKVGQQVEDIRSELLRALFPPTQPRGSKHQIDSGGDVQHSKA